MVKGEDSEENGLLGKGHLDLEGLGSQRGEFGLEETPEGCWTINAKCFRMVSHPIGSHLSGTRRD